MKFRGTPIICAGVLILALSMAFLPNVDAGTQNDPEIADDEGDSQVSVSCTDIVSVWFGNETNAAVDATIKLKDLADGLLPLGFCQLSIDFNDSPKGTSFYGAEANFYVTESGTSVKYELTLNDENIYVILCSIDGKIDFEENTITMTIPKAKASCDRALYKVRADSHWGPALNIVGYGGTNRLVGDVAPDEGYGRDYNFLFQKPLKNASDENATAGTEQNGAPHSVPGFDGSCPIITSLIASASIFSIRRR